MGDRQKYEADVMYEVWRSGGDSDAVDYDRVDDRYWDGADVEEAASEELHAQEPELPSWPDDDCMGCGQCPECIQLCIDNTPPLRARGKGGRDG